MTKDKLVEVLNVVEENIKSDMKNIKIFLYKNGDLYSKGYSKSGKELGNLVFIPDAFKGKKLADIKDLFKKAFKDSKLSKVDQTVELLNHEKTDEETLKEEQNLASYTEEVNIVFDEFETKLDTMLKYIKRESYTFVDVIDFMTVIESYERFTSKVKSSDRLNEANETFNKLDVDLIKEEFSEIKNKDSFSKKLGETMDKLNGILNDAGYIDTAPLPNSEVDGMHRANAEYEKEKVERVRAILNVNFSEEDEILNYMLSEEKLTADERKELDKDDFGIPSQRQYPLNDSEHVRKAIQYFGKCKEKYRSTLADNIKKKADEFEISISKDSEVYGYIDEDLLSESSILEQFGLLVEEMN